MITMLTMCPDPKNIKSKGLLLIKARQELEDDDDGGVNNFFPSGIENEVVFMEITGKTLSNLYSSCQVSHPPHFYFWLNFQAALIFKFWLGTEIVATRQFEFLNSSSISNFDFNVQEPNLVISAGSGIFWKKSEIILNLTLIKSDANFNF